MTQPMTNAQFALHQAVQLLAIGGHLPLIGTTEELATGFLRWLDANTPPTPDHVGE